MRRQVVNIALNLPPGAASEWPARQRSPRVAHRSTPPSTRDEPRPAVRLPGMAPSPRRGRGQALQDCLTQRRRKRRRRRPRRATICAIHVPSSASSGTGRAIPAEEQVPHRPAPPRSPEEPCARSTQRAWTQGATNVDTRRGAAPAGAIDASRSRDEADRRTPRATERNVRSATIRSHPTGTGAACTVAGSTERSAC